MDVDIIFKRRLWPTQRWQPPGLHRCSTPFALIPPFVALVAHNTPTNEDRRAGMIAILVICGVFFVPTRLFSFRPRPPGIQAAPWRIASFLLLISINFFIKKIYIFYIKLNRDQGIPIKRPRLYLYALLVPPHAPNRIWRAR